MAKHVNWNALIGDTVRFPPIGNVRWQSFEKPSPIARQKIAKARSGIVVNIQGNNLLVWPQGAEPMCWVTVAKKEVKLTKAQRR